MADNTAEVKITGDASGATAAMETAATAVDAGAANITEALEGMADGAAEAMAVFGDAVREKAASINESLETINGTIGSVGKTFQLLSEIMVGGIVGEKLAELANMSGEYAEKIEHASQETGIAAESLEGLKFAAEVSNVGFDTLQKSLTLLSRNMAMASSGTGTASQAFKAFGLDAKQLTQIPLDQALMKISDAFKGTADSQEKLAAATAIFGRGARELIPFLDQGSQGIEGLKQKAADLGLTLNGETLESLDKMHGQFLVMHGAMESVGLVLSQALIPGFANMATKFTEGVTKGGPFKDFIDDLATAIKASVTIVTYLAEGFQILGNVVGAAGVKIKNYAVLMEGEYASAEDVKKATEENTTVTKDLHEQVDAITKSYDELRTSMEKVARAPQLPADDRDPTKVKFHPNADAKPDPSQMAAIQEYLDEEKLKYEQSNGLRQMDLADIEAYWERVKTLYVLNAKDAIDVDKQIAQSKMAVNKQTLDQQNQLATEEISSNEKMGLDQITADEAHAKAEFAAKKISADELMQLDIQFEAQRLNIQAGALGSRLALLAQDPTTNAVAMQKIKDEILQVEQQFTNRVQALHDTAAKQDEAIWDKVSKSMVSSFGSAFEGILTGTETFSQAMQQVFKGILNVFVGVAENMATKWIETNLLNKTTTQTTAAGGVAANAAVAGSGAFAATAAIPFVGPELAPAAGTLAYSLAMGYQALVPAGFNGFDVPQGVNPLTQLHQREMVLPAGLADTVRAGGIGGGGGHTFNISVSAIDAKGVSRLFNSSGGALVQTLMRQIRLGGASMAGT
jgi:transcriptional regulator with XRE-family HTH domain